MPRREARAQDDRHGQPQGGYADVYELICCYCGGDPDLDYRHVSAELQRICGPYPIAAGIAAYGRHAEQHRRQATQPRESPAARRAGEQGHGHNRP